MMDFQPFVFFKVVNSSPEILFLKFVVTSTAHLFLITFNSVIKTVDIPIELS